MHARVLLAQGKAHAALEHLAKLLTVVEDGRIRRLGDGLSVPLQLFVYVWPDPTVALLVYTVPVVLGSMYLGPMLAMVHGMVQPRMRAFASSILFFVLNLIGLGLGPLITGILSDTLAVSMGLAEGLRWALVIVTLANAWCVIHYLLGARTLRRDLLSHAGP